VSQDALTSLIASLGRAQRVDEAEETFQSLGRRGFRYRPDDVNSLFAAYSSDPERSVQLLREMQSIYRVQPDAKTFLALVRTLASAGQLSRACGLLEGLAETNRILSREAINAGIQYILEKGGLDWGFHVVWLLRLKGVSMSHSVYHGLIRASFSSSRGLVIGGWRTRYRNTRTVLGWMKEDNCLPSIETYEIILGTNPVLGHLRKWLILPC